MSDFDKEAERERLREKYEQDQADREATQRMSDLLLKGARMTNTHCDACGDPLFQQSGVTFCPSCHGGPEGVDGRAPEGTDAAASGDEPAPEASTQSAQGTTDTTSIDVEAASSGETEAQESEPASAQTPRDAPEPSSSDARREDPSPDRPRTRPERRSRPPRHHAGSADLENGRAALIEALEKFAGEAAAADDPRYARECLEAAREASEALAALDR